MIKIRLWEVEGRMLEYGLKPKKFLSFDVSVYMMTFEALLLL